MPDIACEYLLATPGGNITFNDGSTDQFYIGNILGLAGTTLRTPQDDVPYGHGGIGHNFWRGARHITIEGSLLILSVPCGNQMNEIRNEMEDDLLTALESIGALTTDTGTLDWTPQGLSARQLTVRYEVPLECPHDQNFLLRNFTFGLVAENPDWT